MTARTCPPRRHQRGAALLTAMIIVTLVATLSVAMVWQQWRAIQVEGAERARTQSAWILSAATDYAKRILREDRLAYTALTSPYATPLQESRLSTFLAADSDNSADSELEAFLSGTISDAQGRFNITNLVNAAGDKTADAAQLAAFTRLCQNLGLDPGIAQRIYSAMHEAVATPPSAAAPLLPTTLAQLSWLGVDDATIATLQPYAILLPYKAPGAVTMLNANTATKETLAAVMNIDPSTAGRIVQTAATQPFPDAITLAAAAGSNALVTYAGVNKSSYFEVRGKLRLADHVLQQRSLLFRDPSTNISTIVQSELVSNLEQVGS